MSQKSCMNKSCEKGQIMREVVKVAMTGILFIFLFERAFKMMESGVYFIVITLLVAELYCILIYTN